MTDKCKRGRPPGDKGIDDAMLRRIAERMVDAPTCTRRGLIVAEVGWRNTALVKRLERKLRTRGEALRAEVRAERAARPRAVPAAGRGMPVGSLADGVRAAASEARVSATVAAARQAQALYENVALRRAYEAIDGAPARLARAQADLASRQSIALQRAQDLINGPTARYAHAQAQLASARIAAMLGSGGTFGAVAEAHRQTVTVYERLRREGWI